MIYNIVYYIFAKKTQKNHGFIKNKQSVISFFRQINPSIG